MGGYEKSDEVPRPTTRSFVCSRCFHLALRAFLNGCPHGDSRVAKVVQEWAAAWAAANKNLVTRARRGPNGS